MRIAVAMSGGMDSTATALILKNQGHEVIGLHMMLHCASGISWERAVRAATEVGVPLEKVDLAHEFSKLIVAHFIQEYQSGRTPSPCPRCNRWVKTSRLWEKAATLGCEGLATGHYAVIRKDNRLHDYSLHRGVDRRKDQSYFLFMLTREALSRTIFPLGALTKSQVRDFLRVEGVSVWESDESQELCFVPNNDYRRFLAENGVVGYPGPIKDLEGRVLGVHKGIIHYTVGQRRGLGICRARPLYVVRLDAESNTVWVGHKEETFVKFVRIIQTNLLIESDQLAGTGYLVKVRSTATAVPARLERLVSEEMVLQFDDPQSGVAPGQAAVLYAGEQVVGGGWIEEAW